MDRPAPHALVIVENLPVPFDRRVWQEARALRAAGWQVSVICPATDRHPARAETLEGIRILRHPLRPAAGVAGYLREYLAALFWQTRLSLRLRREGRIDVIQGCSPPDLIFLVARLHRLLWGTPYVFDHHDLSPELFEAKFGRQGFLRRLLHRALLAAERASFRAAAASIATNETFRDIAVARGGMDPARVFIVKSYPDITRFRRVAPDPGLAADGRKVVGYVGIMGEQDGVATLVRAMAAIRDRGRDDVMAEIIGDGPALPGLRALAAELGLGERVRFPGYVSGEALLARLSAVDLGVIPDPPNVFNAKLSMNKVFEYMMMGLPFVLFDLAQARRESGGAGLVIPEHSPQALADGILALLDDPARRQAMAAAGRAAAETGFRWEGEVQALLAAYGTALGRPLPTESHGP